MMVRYRSTACLSVGAVQLITFIYLTMQRTEHTTSVFCAVFSFISKQVQFSLQVSSGFGLGVVLIYNFPVLLLEEPSLDTIPNKVGKDT